MSLTAPEILAEIPDLTYKQLDHWTRCGYLEAENARPGSGTPRTYLPEKVPFLRAMLAFVEDGVTPKRAAELAGEIVRYGETTLAGYVLVATEETGE